MIHGVVLASHGDALHWGLDKHDPIDFAQEVWSFVGLGLQLQELYVAPRHMTAESWDLLAEGLRWARGRNRAQRLSSTSQRQGEDTDVANRGACLGRQHVIGVQRSCSSAQHGFQIE